MFRFTIRDVLWLTVVVAVSLASCGTSKSTPSPGVTVGRASGGASSASREVKFSVDGGGGIVMQEGTATINFAEGKVVVEKARVLLNDKEIATVPADSKVVETDYTAGKLTITADGNQVYEAKPRE